MSRSEYKVCKALLKEEKKSKSRILSVTDNINRKEFQTYPLSYTNLFSVNNKIFQLPFGKNLHVYINFYFNVAWYFTHLSYLYIQIYLVFDFDEIWFYWTIYYCPNLIFFQHFVHIIFRCPNHWNMLWYNLSSTASRYCINKLKRSKWELLLKFYLGRSHSSILRCFSLYTNAKTIVSINTQNDTELACINGIKVLNTIWVIFGHRFLMNSFSGSINYMYLLEVNKRLWLML